MQKSRTATTPKDAKFTKPAEVDTLVTDLRAKLGIKENADGSYEYTQGWAISDLRDDKNRQYVDLVQKGGGVWGIALIGFTYVLEEVGVRFLRLAGTSAGSINTVLMTAIGNKEDKKSEQVLELLAEKNIFDFVDGHRIVRWAINQVMKSKDKQGFLKKIGIGYVVLLVACLFILITPMDRHHILEASAFTVSSILIVLPLLAIALLGMLYQRMGQAGMGINPGENFLIWLREVLWKANRLPNQEPNYKSKRTRDRYFTTDELIEKVRKCPDLHLVVDHPNGVEGLEGDITVITAELVTENKVELPAQRALFSTTGSYQPFEDAAELVRTSMAIPLFFESFYVRNIDVTKTEKEWSDRFRIKPPTECRFVDGGVMSNFPINVYFNPHVDQPRLPTIGINLISSDPEEENKMTQDANSNKAEINTHQWNILNFAGRLFNATKNYYDKDFILKNDVVEKSIAQVDVGTIHWLHFGMDNTDKEKLFMQGAKAAFKFLSGDEWPGEKPVEKPPEADLDTFIEPTHTPTAGGYIKGFNWTAYKTARKDMKENLQHTYPANE